MSDLDQDYTDIFRRHRAFAEQQRQEALEREFPMPDVRNFRDGSEPWSHGSLATIEDPEDAWQRLHREAAWLIEEDDDGNKPSDFETFEEALAATRDEFADTPLMRYIEACEGVLLDRMDPRWESWRYFTCANGDWSGWSTTKVLSSPQRGKYASFIYEVTNRDDAGKAIEWQLDDDSVRFHRLRRQAKEAARRELQKRAETSR